MADGLNQKINDHDSISTILSSDNFLNLDANIQNKMVDYLKKALIYGHTRRISS